MNFNFFNNSKEVGLVLGSGGARGLAHIGVIEGLIENDYKIKKIVGCSMGALIGAIYASGKLSDFKKWIIELDFWDVFDLMDFTFDAQGFIKGEKVFKEMESFLSTMNIEDLDISYLAVATDLVNKKEVLFDKGNLYDAVRSSVAIPTILTPMEIDGIKYIDGGIVNPLPVNHMDKKHVDVVVAVNLNGRNAYTPPANIVSMPEEDLTNYEKQIESIKSKIAGWFTKSDNKKNELSYFDLLNNSFDLTQDSLADFILKRHKPDILVELSREACGTMQFYRAEEMIAAGREALEKVLKNQ